MSLPDPEAQAAEVTFQDAYDLAARLGARTPQLRAALRLYRLAHDRADAKERAGVLRAVYETFTEGFETADLIEARDLLADAPS